MRNLRTVFRLVTVVVAFILFGVIVWVYNRQLAGGAGQAVKDTMLSFGYLLLLVGVPAILLFLFVTQAFRLAHGPQEGAGEAAPNCETSKG